MPRVKKGFFKFWWNEEVNLLKEESVESDKLQKSVGKPRDGPIFANRQSCRLKYRKCLTDNRKFEAGQYTNDLHDALLQKNNISFWQCWRELGARSLSTRKSCVQVDGCVDPNIVASRFSEHFARAYS